MTPSRLILLLSAFVLATTAWASDSKSSHYIEVSALDLSTILPPPPAAGSPESKSEIETLIELQSTATPEDFARARKDEKRDPSAFTNVLGSWFTEENLPVTFQLLNNAEKESQSISEKIKRLWKRPRPPVIDNRVQARINLPSSPSYPSGHSLQGAEWALILAQLAPDKKDALLERGKNFGQSRVVGGVHYPSDMVAGQLLGEKLFAQLMENPAFQEDLKQAKKEFDEARAKYATN